MWNPNRRKLFILNANYPMNMDKTSVLHKLLFEWNDEKKRYTRIENMVTTTGDLPIPTLNFAPYKAQTTRQETKE